MHFLGIGCGGRHNNGRGTREVQQLSGAFSIGGHLLADVRFTVHLHQEMRFA
jgi:hypothetical protein